MEMETLGINKLTSLIQVQQHDKAWNLKSMETLGMNKLTRLIQLQQHDKAWNL